VTVPYWVQGSTVVLQFPLATAPFELDKVFFAANSTFSGVKTSRYLEFGFTLARSGSAQSPNAFRFKAKGATPDQPSIACTFHVAPPPAPPLELGAATAPPAKASKEPKEIKEPKEPKEHEKAGKKDQVEEPPFASSESAPQHMSADFGMGAPAKVRGGVGDSGINGAMGVATDQPRSASSSMIAVGITLALLCGCGLVLRRSSTEAKAARVAQSDEPKKVYLQAVDGEETVLTLPMDDLADVDDVLEAVARLGSEASGKEVDADALELYTQDAGGHAKRVRNKTPFTDVLAAHALLARPARVEHHRHANNLD